MRVYTSYYANVSKEPGGLIPVRISTQLPSWFPWHCEELPELYPGWSLVNDIKSGFITEDEYTEKYKAKLAELRKLDIVNKLVEISRNNGGRDVVLLCYEAPDKFCHRHLVADWLNWEVEELPRKAGK